MTTRRDFLRFAGAGAGLLAGPGYVFASAATQRRFVFIIQRGAADALDTLVPYADPAYARLRGPIAVDASTALKLDGQFALHPALTETAWLYAQKQALLVHAVASSYRDRSHFDGQNVLETGGARPYALKDGWLARLVALLPDGAALPVAISPTVPLALRGAARVGSYAPSALPRAGEDLLQRVASLYAGDEQLHASWSAAMQARAMAGTPLRRNPAELGELAARFLSQPSGPRIAMLETEGWDTHSAQAQRHAAGMRRLDAMLAALRAGLGPAWEDTVVLVATEFGRTVAANGTGGTDHGTASVALLLGGAVRGGRMLGDWPGLEPAALYQGRDLQPTTSLASVIAGATGECYGLDPQRVARALFPQAGRERVLAGLVARATVG